MLCRAITDINQWPAWDKDLEATTHDGKLATGSPFLLRPRGGPQVAMEIVEATAPRRLVDLAHMPLAKMRATHVFRSMAAGARFDVTIEVWGILGFLWDGIVARKQAAGAPEQTRAFIAYAGNEK